MRSLTIRALWSLSLCSLATAAACADGPSGPPAKITVSTTRTPELIAFRDGPDADWHVPAATAPGTYELEVHGPYVVTVVCDDGRRVGTRQIARTPDDERELAMPCGQALTNPVTVTGTMVQPGAVALGRQQAMSSSPGWQIRLTTTAAPAPHDLIATSGDRIAIRRDQVFATDTADLAIDLTQEGAALERVAFTAPDAGAAEDVHVLVELETATTLAGMVYSGAPAGAKVAPAAVLRETDRQRVSLFAVAGDAYRFTGRLHRAGAPTAFALPAPLAAELGSAGGAVTASWRALPAHDRLVLSAFGGTATSPSRYHELEESQRFLAATGETEAALESDLPGYLPAWRADLGQEHLISVAAYGREAEEDRGSVISKIQSGLR
ncbi:MAG TPA: hypothetical protein VNO30_34650 [Kofleriaceae bacterium]|nr:hypothetical protein [Kofleriaceae bacterium]